MENEANDFQGTSETLESTAADYRKNNIPIDLYNQVNCYPKFINMVDNLQNNNYLNYNFNYYNNNIQLTNPAISNRNFSSEEIYKKQGFSFLNDLQLREGEMNTYLSNISGQINLNREHLNNESFQLLSDILLYQTQYKLLLQEISNNCLVIDNIGEIVNKLGMNFSSNDTEV